MGKPHYLYVVVRQDLPLPHQITQACHAAFEQGLSCTKEPSAKESSGIHLVTLAVPDEQALQDLSAQLEDIGIPFHYFFEPDDLFKIGKPVGYTALSAGPIRNPKERKIFSRFSLWYA